MILRDTFQARTWLKNEKTVKWLSIMWPILQTNLGRFVSGCSSAVEHTPFESLPDVCFFLFPILSEVCR